MGLSANIFNFLTNTGTNTGNLFGLRTQEAEKAKEDILKIEGQIEYTNNLLGIADNNGSKLKRPLIG